MSMMGGGGFGSGVIPSPSPVNYYNTSIIKTEEQVKTEEAFDRLQSPYTVFTKKEGN
jgi:hypothetical protein